MKRALFILHPSRKTSPVSTVGFADTNYNISLEYRLIRGKPLLPVMLWPEWQLLAWYFGLSETAAWCGGRAPTLALMKIGNKVLSHQVVETGGGLGLCGEGG